MLPSKNDIRLVRSLHQKKFRNETGLFLAEGRKLVGEALESGFRIHSIFSSDNDFCAKHESAFHVSPKEMEMMSTLTSPSEYLAVLYQQSKGPAAIKEATLVVLDGISDPGNMGTIIRSADWFGFRQIVCTPDCVELYNPKVVQATMGSIFRIHAFIMELPEIALQLKNTNHQLIAADLAGSSLYEYEFSGHSALVIGSESHGVRREMKELVDAFITIPGIGGGESLNASVAAAICMSELFRRGRS